MPFGILNGMKQSISIDRAGRVVLPKPLRDRFHLREGDVLSLEIKGDAIELRPAKTGNLMKVNGVLVYSDSSAAQSEGVDYVAEMREERIAELIRRGESEK
jgi:AbrB family looped-hinge helix DNA binding protein